MPKRKHVKKNAVVPCTDANQRVRESIAEKKRVAEAMAKKYEMMMEQYQAEMKRRELLKQGTATPTILNPKAVDDPVNA